MKTRVLAATAFAASMTLMASTAALHAEVAFHPVCNETAQPVYLAFRGTQTQFNHFHNRTYTLGWFRIEPGECHQVPYDRVVDPDIFVQDADGTPVMPRDQSEPTGNWNYGAGARILGPNCVHSAFRVEMGWTGQEVWEGCPREERRRVRYITIDRRVVIR